MLAETFTDIPNQLTAEIDRLLGLMSSLEPHSDEYIATADQLTKLYKLLEIDANLALKVGDQGIKRKESEANQEIKERELTLKDEDNAYNHNLKNREFGLKETEVHANVATRTHETEIKLVESQASLRVKNAEADLKKQELELNKRVKVDTIAIIAGNIIGIGLILGYERAHIVTSKALGFVLKSK